MFLYRSVRVFALFNFLFVAGCTATGNMSSLFPSAGDHPIRIESEPTEAEVYVMGEKVGVTPLQIMPKDVFPNIYPREKTSLYGRVTLKKSGCAGFTRTVDSEISSVGLRAKLDCGDPMSASVHPATNVPRTSETVEQRLDKLKELLGKGLISEEEAKKARERILNDL